MSKDHKSLTQPSSAVKQFLQTVARTPARPNTQASGRLIFALDATASREPTWDRACQIQGQMFAETANLGGLQVQLCYYRGFHQFHSEAWCSDTRQLQDQMSRVRCLGGHTQIGRLLTHAIEETQKQKVQALVFIGDAVEEDVDAICAKAGQLGLLNVPVFAFQEGLRPEVTSVFQQIAQLTGGACVPFNHHSPDELRDLLAAVAIFASGGRKALAQFSQRSGRHVALLGHQLSQSSGGR